MATRQYIGARYVPIIANPVEWSNTNTYEPLTIVTYQGNSYTSRQFVPAGIDINNTSYWAETGNYNAQVEQYRQEVANVDSELDDIDTRISDLDSSVDTRISNLDISVDTRISNLQDSVDSEIQDLVDDVDIIKDDVSQLKLSEQAVYKLSFNEYFNLRTLTGFSNANFQGGCIYNGYLYVAALVNGDDNNAYLLKFDIISKQLITTYQYSDQNHANSVFVCNQSDNSKCICCVSHRTSKLYFHDLNTLSLLGQKTSRLGSSALYLESQDTFVTYIGSRHKLNYFKGIGDGKYAKAIEVPVNFPTSINNNDVILLSLAKNETCIIIATNEYYSPSGLQNNNILKIVYLNGIELGTIVPILENPSEIENLSIYNNTIYLITVNGIIHTCDATQLLDAINRANGISRISGNILHSLNMKTIVDANIESVNYTVTTEHISNKVIVRVPAATKLLHNKSQDFIYALSRQESTRIYRPDDSSTDFALSSISRTGTGLFYISYAYSFNNNEDIYYLRRISASRVNADSYTTILTSSVNYDSDYDTNIKAAIEQVHTALNSIIPFNTNPCGIYYIVDNGADLATELQEII